MLKLYFSPGACSLGSHIALEESGAPYEIERINFKDNQQRSAGYLSINPKGRVPVLLTDRGTLTESPVILDYIGRTYPQANLVPSDSFVHAEMQSFNIFLTSTVHIAFAHVFRPSRYADGDDAAAAMKVKAKTSIHDYFGLIEERFADGRPFVCGEQYTVADPYLLVFSRWLDRSDLGPVDAFPKVAVHRKRMEERAAVKKVLAVEAAA